MARATWSGFCAVRGARSGFRRQPWRSVCCRSPMRPRCGAADGGFSAAGRKASATRMVRAGTNWRCRAFRCRRCVFCSRGRAGSSTARRRRTTRLSRAVSGIGGLPELRWYLDGKLIGEGERAWWHPRAGLYRLELRSADGQSIDQVEFAARAHCVEPLSGSKQAHQQPGEKGQQDGGGGTGRRSACRGS